MQIKRTTICGRCGKEGVTRTLYSHRDMEDTKAVIYACSDPVCTRAEGVLLLWHGSKTFFIKKPGDVVGSTFDISKYEINKQWKKETN